MTVKFYNSHRKHWFFFYMGYLLITCILFKVFGLHLSTLGDHRLYGRGTLEFAYSPEITTINIYTILGSIGINPLLLGIIFIASVTYYYVNRLPQNLLSVYIYFCIFNPFTIQFLIYESKEAILSIVTSILLLAKLNRFHRIIFAALLFAIRPMYFVVYVSSLLIKDKAFLFLSKRVYVISSIFVIVVLLYVLESYDYTTTIIGIIRQSFLPYSQATTNRNWIPVIETIFSLDFFNWYIIGLYTAIFGNLVLEWTTFLFLIVGFGKIILFSKVNNRSLSNYYLTVLAFSAYAVPLSVYNIGSSLRYCIPLFITFLLLYCTSDRNKHLI